MINEIEINRTPKEKLANISKSLINKERRTKNMRELLTQYIKNKIIEISKLINQLFVKIFQADLIAPLYS